MATHIVFRISIIANGGGDFALSNDPKDLLLDVIFTATAFACGYRMLATVSAATQLQLLLECSRYFWAKRS